MATTRNPITKTEASEQLCRVGAPAALTNSGLPDLINQATAPLADQFGRLIVIVDEPGLTLAGNKPVRFATSGASRVTQFATPQTTVELVQVAGYNASTGLLFVQIWESPVFDTVNSFSVLRVVIPVPGNFSTFSYGLSVINSLAQPNLSGPRFIIAISTSELTFTAPASDFMHVTVNFK
jgi:hypothetical protein